MSASTTVAILLTIGCTSALADNAALTSGGLPTMLKAHRSVAMESEMVRMTVHWDHVDVACSFLFVNHGPTCSVNMGFPDFGLWAYDYPRKKPVTMFKKYESYVDGKRVITKLVLGNGRGEQWQTKTVRFAKNGRHVVREVYRTELGGVGVSRTEAWGFASYILHTGASWHGNIGKATVIAILDPDTGIQPPLLIKIADLRRANGDDISKHMRRAGGVIVAGMAQPVVAGRTLTFVRENWKPAESDDIYIGYRIPESVIERLRKRGAPRK